MFYVTAIEVPTVALFVDIKLAYAFRKTLLDKGLVAIATQTDKEE